VFGSVVPEAQRRLAALLGTGLPGQIAFAANTHDFVVRIASCFDETRPLRILTTDGEFHSFARQAARLEEQPRVRLQRVPVEPVDTFDARFADALAGAEFDLVYLSQVFFNSGYVVADLASLVAACRSAETVVAIDGYHAVGALPVDLRPIAERVFYLGGGYKYLQAGEGFGFLHVPPACVLRPLDTGWFAQFGTLTHAPSGGQVAYADDGFRFWGATWDPGPAYRFLAVMDLWQREGVTPAGVHAHARALQERFLAGLENGTRKALDPATLVTPRPLDRQGNFLTFRFPGAPDLHAALHERGVETDLRGDRIRFGFGPYQDEADVDALLAVLARL
jgi:selenocysteine lyase/cysteine desulfurase